MRNIRLDEAQVGMKTTGRNINNFRYADDTTFMGESEEELKSPLMKVKQESEKVGLNLNIWQKNKDHGIQSYLFSSVQSLSHVQLFATPWTAACQASLSMASSQSLLKLTSIESLMPSNNLILCHPLLLLPSIFPSIRVFSNESVLCIRGQSIGVSASASVFPMNIQGWSPLGWTGWISLQSYHFMANRLGNNGNSKRLYIEGLQNHCRWWLQPRN